MHERDEPGRIEIELTSNEPSVAAASSRDGEGARLVARPVDDELAGENRRLFGLAALVGVIGLVVGVAIGRAGANATPSASPSTPPTTVDQATNQTIATPGPSEAPAVTSPPSSPQSRPTLTTLVAPLEAGRSDAVSQPVVVDTVEVAPAAARFPIEVVGRAVGGDIVRVDLSTGRTMTQPVDAAGGPPIVLAGAGWSAIPTWDGSDGWTVVDDDGSVSIVEMAGVVPGWRHATEGLFWSRGERGFASDLVEVDITGTETGRVIELVGTPVFADPSGAGVVVTAPGGTYVTGEVIRTRLSSGRVLALGRERAVAFECDDTLACGHVVIDRTSGERRPIDFSIEPGETVEALASWSTASPVNVNEDAVLALVSDPATDEPPRGGVIDLASGSFTEITERGGAALMRWAPDGRSVLWLDRGRLLMFDPELGDSVAVAADLALLTAFTVRGALPSVDGG